MTARAALEAFAVTLAALLVAFVGFITVAAPPMDDEEDE